MEQTSHQAIEQIKNTGCHNAPSGGIAIPIDQDLINGKATCYKISKSNAIGDIVANALHHYREGSLPITVVFPFTFVSGAINISVPRGR